MFLSFEEYFPVSGLSETMALREFLKSLIQQTYIRDIVERYNLKNVDVLDELFDILASGIGSHTNPTKLANTFESAKQPRQPIISIYDFLLNRNSLEL